MQRKSPVIAGLERLLMKTTDEGSTDNYTINSGIDHTVDEDIYSRFDDPNEYAITMSKIPQNGDGELEPVWPYNEKTKFLAFDHGDPTNLLRPNTYFADADRDHSFEYAEGGSWCKAAVKYYKEKDEEKEKEKGEEREEAKIKNSKDYLQTLKMALSLKRLVLDDFFKEVLNEKGKKINVDSSRDIKFAIGKLFEIPIRALTKRRLIGIRDADYHVPIECRKLVSEVLNYKSMIDEYKSLTESSIPVEKCSARNSLGIRKSITRFSAKSKRNVQKKLSSIDQKKLTIAPQFLTLTWQSMPTSSEEIKIAFERWRRKFLHKFPEGCFFWRLEFSTAKLPRPHFHLVIMETDLTRHKEWISSSWHKSCYPSKSLRKDNAAHLKAGTSVEKIKSWKSVVGYSSKYVTKENDSTPGWWVGSRYWGVGNPKVFNELMSVKEIDLTEKQFVEIQKIMKDEMNRRIIASARISKKIIVDTEFISSEDAIGKPYIDHFDKTDEVSPLVRHSYYSSDLSHMGYLVSNRSEDGYEIGGYTLVDGDGETLALGIEDSDCRFLRDPQGSVSLSFFEGLPSVIETLTAAGVTSDGR